jgi:alkylation response protein AidB-like acyl-CoA dehydrogenase
MDFKIPDELKQIQMLVRRFVREELQPLEQLVEERDEFPEELRKPLINRSIELGIRNMAVPERYGGGGLGVLAQVLASEESGWTSEAITQGLLLGGDGGTLDVASEKQRQQYFLPSLRGDKELCSAWTEPDAGGDAAGIKTHAVKEGNGWVINGTKHFSTNADRAQFFIVGAVTNATSRKSDRFTQFIVDRETAGFSIGAYQPMMGRHGLHSYELVFQECYVPDENVLGEVGGGLRNQLAGFGAGRLLMGARMIGTADRALEMSLEQAKRRQTFGQLLATRQAVQWMLVDMSIDIHATRMMTYHAAWEIEQGIGARARQSRQAMIKLFATNMACRALDNAIQIHGGMGYSRMLPLERMYRDIRLFRIAEGPDEMMRHVIARELLQMQLS